MNMRLVMTVDFEVEAHGLNLGDIQTATEKALGDLEMAGGAGDFVFKPTSAPRKASTSTLMKA